MGRFVILLFVIGVMTSHKSFVDPAALPQTHADKGGVMNDHVNGGSPENTQDVEVRELESLKHPQEKEGKAVQIVKSQSTSIINENGKHNERHDLSEYIDENGKLVARVHQHSESSSVVGGKPHEKISTELEVPSEGVHQTIIHDSDNEGQKESVKAFPGAARLMTPNSDAIPQPPPILGVHETTENGNRRSFNADITQEENNNVDHYSSYSGIQYSPLDMAEYIFWTGDEKGVTLAIEEFLQDGLMTREEAIAFLQEIKYNMDYLQTHYAQQRLRSAAEERLQQDRQMQESQYKQNFDYNSQKASPLRKFNHENMLNTIATGVYERNNNIAPLNVPQMPLFSDMRQELYKKSVQDNLLQTTYKLPEQYEKDVSPAITEEEYEEMLEKLRVADVLYTEYSLEEIIYQLAKVMFSQSLSRGSTEAQLALQKFTNYLEAEAEQGRISKSLEKKVLDVLIESLTDTLTEHPEFVSVARTGLGGSNSILPGNKVLRQLLEMNSPMQTGMMGNFREEVSKAQAQQNKFMHVPLWMKSKEQSVGEHQSSVIPMQAIKRFKMSI